MSLLAPRTPLDFIALGYQLTCYCQHWPGPCRHSGDVTMQRIAERLGAEFDLRDGRLVLLSRLVCSKCGQRYPKTILSRIEASVPLLSHPPAERDAVPIEEATRRWLAQSAAARERSAAIGYDPPRGRRVRKFRHR